MQTCDILVLGAGIGGASAAALLARRAKVVLIEREPHAGYHSTGRSAALFTATYGNHVVRMLTRASRSYLDTNAEGLAENPILTPRGLLHFAMPDQLQALESLWMEVSPRAPDIERLDTRSALELVPVLRPHAAAAAIYEPRAMDIDVHGLHGSYLRRLRRDGGEVVFNAPVEALARGKTWSVKTPRGSFAAPILVNAAGAWADEVARLAGLPPIGLVPMRRTALLVAPPGMDARTWPMAINVAETFYFKPDAGKIMISPADETPTCPCDAQPEDIDVAIAVDRFEAATTITVNRVEHKWAGLRSFVPDRSPVVGFDPRCEGFFWLAAQGGYGIHAAHALARCAETLLLDDRIPEEVASYGVEAAALSPGRLVGGSAGGRP